MTIPENSIPAPSPNRSSLKVNVFEFARDAATTLAPLFPDFDTGSFVPCLSVFRDGPGRGYGRFQHFNTVDEVHRDIRELSEELPQEGYQRACDEFNADERIRSCRRCRVIHPRIDTQGTHWAAVASTSRESNGD
jgi:hypothetical protein